MEKIKNLPVMRFVAFAVSVAIILGLLSVMLSFTASAENVSSDRVTLEDGTQVPTINGFSIIGSKSVTNITVNYLKKTYGSGLIFLIAQDKTTKDVYYTRYPQIFLLDTEDIYCYFPSGYGCTPPYVTSETSVYDYLYIDDSYKAIHEGYGRSVSPSFYDKSLTTVSPNLSNLNYYWCYASNIKYNYRDACSLSTIIGKSDDSGFKEGIKAPPGGGSDNGRFTCFGDYKDYSYDEHLSDLISESIDYTKAVSYGGYGRGKCYFQKDANDKDSFIFTRSESKQLVRYNSTDISFTFYNATDDLGSCSVRLSATMPRFMERESDSPLDPIKFLTQHAMSYYHFNRIAVISSDSLKSIPAKSTVTATLDLTGFTSIAHSGKYLIELVNSITGDVVSSVMFDYENDGQSFKQSNDNIDVKYKYDNGNITPDVDLPPDDTGHINGIPDGGLDSSNNKYTFNYQNPNITDIFGTLDNSINSISDFFQMCFSLLPLAISTIIIGGFALLVLLRVLGR